KKASSFYRFTAVFCCLILPSLILLSAARIQFIGFATGLFLLFLWVALRKRKWKRTGMGFLILLGSFTTLLFSLPQSRQRLMDTYHEFRALKGLEEVKQTNHRVFLWKYGTEVILENLWSGTGTGAADDALYEKLKYSRATFCYEHTHYYRYYKRYNYHTYYMLHF